VSVDERLERAIAALEDAVRNGEAHQEAMRTLQASLDRTEASVAHVTNSLDDIRRELTQVRLDFHGRLSAVETGARFREGIDEGLQRQIWEMRHGAQESDGAIAIERTKGWWALMLSAVTIGGAMLQSAASALWDWLRHLPQGGHH
jgi:exonuclease VII small subunit